MMRYWLIASMTVFSGVVAAGSCAQGGTIDPDEPGSPTGAGSGSTGSGGAGGTSAGEGGGASTSGGGGSTSNSSSSGGGSGGAGGKNPCEGVLCDVPPPNECDGQDLKVYSPIGTCDAGACTYGAMTESCPSGCASGACLGDPCIGVTCNNAPPPTCANGSTLAVPQEPGTCDAGSCTYFTSLVNCPFGCANDKCNGDPCAGVACNQAAASFCVDADHLRVRDLPGLCDAQDGLCDYTTHDEFCAFGCVNGACKNDPCVGVVCPAKPSFCADANTSVTYDAGQCINGLPCSYGSTSANCPNGCVNGQCVACTMDAQCAAGQWCGNNQCLPCNGDLHCGAACVPCGGGTPKCNGASCVQCLSAADCGPGQTCDAQANACVAVNMCAPPATACVNAGSQDGGCNNSYKISRLDAGSAAGFTVNNTYGLCNRQNQFTTGNCGGNTGSDAEYRLFMLKNETAAIALTRGNSTCTMSWGGNISLKIYEAACNADCSSCPLTCSVIDHCVQNNNQNINFVAPNNGWYTIVIDSPGPVDDKGGVFYLNVKLACSGGNCACP